MKPSTIHYVTIGIVAVAIIVLYVLLSGCAGGGGLLAMSDNWCTEHGNPPTHCYPVPK
jgi:hypothetical protein